MDNYSIIIIIQSSIDDIYNYLRERIAQYATPQQQARAIFLLLHRVTELVQHPTNDEWYMRDLDEDVTQYVAGRYVTHCLDIFVCDLFSIAMRLHCVEACRKVLGGSELALLKWAAFNSVRMLACEDYFYSIGSVRFTRYQSIAVVYDRLFIQGGSVCRRALCSIQASILFGNGNEVLTHAFSMMSKNVRVRLEDRGEEAAVGILLMLSYFVMLLLSVVYDRCYIIHELDVREASSSHP